jgi:DNA replication and repair protein RecF
VHVSRLALTDFRSYRTVDLRLEPGPTSFTGPNGRGKTNLLEAVGYVATLGSHRAATDAPLVRRGAERAIVRAQADAAVGKPALVEIEINPGRANRARLNRAPVRRPREILGALRAVLFAPEDLALVRGDPGERRRFLDDLLVARFPRFAGIRSDYERVLRQRTALLKSARAAPARSSASGGMMATLDTWDEHLARAGAPLIAGRMELTAALRPLAAKAYAQIADGGGETEMSYRQSSGLHAPAGPAAGGGEPGSPQRPAAQDHDDAGDDDADRDDAGRDAGRDDAGDDDAGDEDVVAVLASGLREAMREARAEELDRGVCLVGPHRDEMELSVSGMPARGYASHGESWSLALALRLGSYELLRSDGEDPVLMLDDVFAELDAGRRARLAELTASAEQVLVTAAVRADVPAVLAATQYEVSGTDGTVVSRVS